MNNIKGNSYVLTPGQERSLPGSPNLLCVPPHKGRVNAILTVEKITFLHFFMFYHLPLNAKF